MHLDEERLQRLLHGELVPRAASTARAHVADCVECRTRVAAAEQQEDEVRALLRHLDHPVRHVDARAVAQKARLRAPRRERWAAGVVLALGLGGAAYALPGSPLPAWIEAVVHWVGGGTEPAPATPVPSPEPGPVPEPTLAGIAVVPAGDLLISFGMAHGQARVTLIDGDEVVVRAPAGAATFTSHVDRLVIDNVDPKATIDIAIPRAAPRVEIRVDHRRVLLKEGPRVTTESSVASRDPYLLPLAATTP